MSSESGRKCADFLVLASRLFRSLKDLVTIDFVQAFLDFNDLSVSLPSVGFHVDLLKYWDGQ